MLSGWGIYFQAILSLTFVLGLIGAAVFVMRRVVFRDYGRLSSGRRRLGMVETLSIDSRRRLLLIRRDGVEHLLLVGGSTDFLIEKNIVPPTVEVQMKSGVSV